MKKIFRKFGNGGRNVWPWISSFLARIICAALIVILFPPIFVGWVFIFLISRIWIVINKLCTLIASSNVWSWINRGIHYVYHRLPRHVAKAVSLGMGFAVIVPGACVLSVLGVVFGVFMCLTFFLDFLIYGPDEGDWEAQEVEFW